MHPTFRKLILVTCTLLAIWLVDSSGPYPLLSLEPDTPKNNAMYNQLGLVPMLLVGIRLGALRTKVETYPLTEVFELSHIERQS